MKNFKVCWETKGYTIIPAETKEEAIEMIQNQPYEFIELDDVVDNLVCVEVVERVDE